MSENNENKKIPEEKLEDVNGGVVRLLTSPQGVLRKGEAALYVRALNRGRAARRDHSVKNRQLPPARTMLD